MREIKFRAWDSEIKCFIPIMEWIEELKHAKFRVLGNEMVTNGWNISNLAVLLKSKNIEIIQYTELKDKNGKEIYEGDILKITSNCFTDKVILLAIVEFWNGSWMINKDYYLHEIDFKTEVIGNVYENPELMEG